MRQIVSIILLLSVQSLFAQIKITNSLGMEFVRIDTGEFMMGKFKPPFPTPSDTVQSITHSYTMWMGDGRNYNAEEFKLAQELATKDSRDGVARKIVRPFYVGTTEVTQQQWERVMGYNRSHFKNQPNA